jgi:hypothetical protein
MQAKIASFSADSGLLPVLTTTPILTKVLERIEPEVSALLKTATIDLNIKRW